LFTQKKGDETMMPLVMADAGEENIIRRVGGSPEMKKHLEDMGFTVGGAVTVMNTIGGNLIVKVKESRVAISKEMAARIMV
jgi:ferrous iron transport protein A